MLMALLPLAGYAESYTEITVTLAAFDEAYDGNAIVAPVVTVNGKKGAADAAGLTEGTDYVLVWKNPAGAEINPATGIVDAGVYTVEAKAKNEGDTFTAATGKSLIKTFTVAKAGTIEVRALNPTMVYGGEAPELEDFYEIVDETIFVGGDDVASLGAPITMPTGFDYTSAGTRTFTLTAREYTNYNVSVIVPTGTLSIAQKAITVATKAEAAIEYGGTVPTWAVADYSAQMKPGDELTGTPTFTYTYSVDNTVFAAVDVVKNAGYYKIKPAGLSNSNYSITFEETPFQINKKALAATMIADIADVYYDGTNKKPTPVVTDASGIATTDYTVKYYVDATEKTGDALNTAFINANTTDYKVKIVATEGSNYSGEAEKVFKVNKKPIQLRTKGENLVYSAQKFNGGAAGDYVLAFANHLQWDAAVYAGDLEGNMLTDAARGYVSVEDPGATFTLSLHKGNSASGTAVAANETLNAGTYTVKVTIANPAKIKNYEITVGNIGKIVIEKKDVTITPKNKTIGFGTVEDEWLTATVQNNDANLWIGTLNAAGTAIVEGTGFQGADTYATVFAAAENANKVSLQRDGSNNAGEYTITATIPSGAKWDNYNFTIAGTGVYKINPSDGIQIWAEDVNSFYHATEPAALTAIIVGIDDSEITPEMRANVNAALTVSWPEGKDASTANAGTYAITVDIDDVKDALKDLVNYDLTDLTAYPGTYTVKRAPLQITAKPQTHIVGEKVDDAKAATVTINTTGLTDADKAALFNATNGIKLAFSAATCVVPVVTQAEADADGDDDITDANVGELKATAATTGWTGTAAAAEDKDLGVWVNGIVIDATAYNAFAGNNYTLDATKAQGALATPGTLYVTVANDPVVFDILATTTTQITDVVGKKVDATISKDEAGKKRTLYANEWNSLVLPFDITPYDFTSAIETYAVFDVLQTTGEAMNFKITINEIPAYTPFLVKVSETVVLSEKKFEGVVIKAIADAAVANDSYIFQGNLAMSTPIPAWIFTANSEESERVQPGEIDLFHNVEGGTGKNAPRPCPAFGAYIKAKPTTPSTEAPVIYIEEADGSTTAITAINADGVAVKAEGWYTLNGVKLQGMPTEKGIYINNGKKIVIK